MSTQLLEPGPFSTWSSAITVGWTLGVSGGEEGGGQDALDSVSFSISVFTSTAVYTAVQVSGDEELESEYPR